LEGQVIQLIVFAVLALGGMAAVGVMIHGHDAKVKATALAPWQPLIEKCQASDPSGLFHSGATAAQCAQQWGDAVGANVTLQTDVAKWQKTAGECDEKTAKAAKERDAALARAREAEQANAPLRQRAKAGEAAQLARMKAPPVALDCPKGLAEIGRNMIELGKDQLRDMPAATPAPTPAPKRDSGVIKIK
jgi:hypothetical protein